jgi:hypothetical protein
MNYLPAPKRVAVIGRNPRPIVELLVAKGFGIVHSKPDAVISFGGDGTIVHSERVHPGVPKLCVRAGKACVKCSLSKVENYSRREHDKSFYCLNCVARALEKVAAGKAAIREEAKLVGTAHYSRGQRNLVHSATALNEAQVHNKSPIHALRCRVLVGDEVVAPIFLGDGVIVATPFGASGYFNAVTRHIFSKGFGVAFNNGIHPRAPLFLDDLKAGVRIEVLRRHGLFVADNYPETVTLVEGDFVTVEEAPEKARIIVV